MKLFNVQIQESAKFSLVEFRPRIDGIYNDDHQKLVFITVSPNPNKKYKIKRENKIRTIKYTAMTHEEQYKYLIEYIRKVYVNLMEHTDWMYIIFEVNQNNELHSHMLLYSKSIQDDYDIRALQKTVYSNQLTQYNKSGNKDWMNNIVYLDKSRIDWAIDYFNKDQSIKKIFPDIYIEH